jgi:hypothetical protein
MSERVMKNLESWRKPMRNAAQLQHGLSARLVSRYARHLEIADAAVKVILQFAIESSLKLVATQPVRQLADHQRPSLKMS